MTPGRGHQVARGAAVVLPGAAAAFGLAAPDELLLGGLAWLGFLIAMLAGWGHLVERVTRARVDLGLRLAWGAALLLAVGGWLLAASACDRDLLLALCAVGFAGHVWRELTCDEPSWLVVGREVAGLRRDPQAAILWSVLVGLVLVHLIAAVVAQHGNPYDDDVAYTPLVKRLLDAGDLDEPFSFRRLSAYGGQSILAALAGVRGTLASIFLVERGVFQLVTLLLAIGLLRRRHRLDPFVAGLVVLVTVLLPDAATNTASYWSGTALFLALYRSAVQLDELPRAGGAVLGGLAAAACSLRQNYIPVALMFPALVLLFRLRRPLAASWRDERGRWRDAAIAGAVLLVPFLYASWRSNATALYPLWPGTANPYLPTRPLVWGAWQELQFFLRIALDPNPVRVMLPLLPVVLLCRDRRRGAPLFALVVACAVGFVMLVHAFSLSDERNLWRYAFGYMTVLALVVAIEAGAGPVDADGDEPSGIRTSLAARVIVIACLLAQIVFSARTSLADYRNLASDLRAARGGPSGEQRATAARYRRLQASIPAGAPVVALLDEPVHLDYARNRIINLDTPGFASYQPGLPMFVGAEAKAAYFRRHRLRYLAFVKSDQSRYFYRRGYWLERIYWDAELWRIVAGYQLDLADSLAELAARYPVRFDEGGLEVIDLGPPNPADPPPPPAADERDLRERYVEELSRREGLLDRWRLMSRGDVVFEEGSSRMWLVERDADGRWKEVPGATAGKAAVPVRWIGPSVHLVVRGRDRGAMRLRLSGRVEVAQIFTRPWLSLSVGGRERDARLVEPDGSFTVEAVVPGGEVRGWTDVYLELSTIGDVRRDPTSLRAARLEAVSWEPAPP